MGPDVEGCANRLSTFSSSSSPSSGLTPSKHIQPTTPQCSLRMASSLKVFLPLNPESLTARGTHVVPSPAGP